MLGPVVVFDAMGVLYRHGNVVAGVLIPYLRSVGCDRTESDIRAAYRSCTLGASSTSALWASLGVGDRASDEDYCQRHELTTGAPELLGRLRDEGVRLLVLSNDAAAWSSRLRARFGLASLVDDWLISSDLGVRKPAPATYQAAIAAAGAPASEIVLVDDRPTNLVAAAAEGLRPVLFHSEDTAANPAPDLNAPSAHGMAELYDVLTT